MKMGLHVVVVGNLGDGFEIIGPFNNGEEAIEWAISSKSLKNTDWCVMALDSPECRG